MVNFHLMGDPTVQQIGHLPATVLLIAVLNHFCTVQRPCDIYLRSIFVCCDPNDILGCRLLLQTKLISGLVQLHPANEDAVSSLTIFGL